MFDFYCPKSGEVYNFISAFFLGFFYIVRRIAAQDSCEPDFLEKCITMGKALFDHPENIFPANATDIDRVCR